MIEVKTLNNVLVDGVSAGAITDVMANYKTRVAETFAALKTWKKADDDKADAKLAAEKAALATTHSTEKATLSAAHAAALAAVQAKLDEAKARIDTLNAEHDEKLAAKQEKIDELESVLGGTAAGQLLLKSRRQEKRAKEIADAEALTARLKAEAEADAATVEVNK